MYFRENRITIPGIIIFNHSHAVCCSLYLAIRLVVAAPATTQESLMVGTSDLRAIPWSVALGYLLPLFMISMPGLSVLNLNTKHVVAAWYQQWNVYIQVCHLLLMTSWTHTGKLDKPAHKGPETLLSNLRPVYALLFAMTVVSVWVPIFISFAIRTSRKIRKTPALNQEKLEVASLLLPPSPWSKVQCKDGPEGGKWLLQLDGIVGGLSSAVWAIALYAEAYSVIQPQEGFRSFCMRLMLYMILGGPIGVATGALWERDVLVLQQQ